MRERSVRLAVTFNIVWAATCGMLAFFALGLHGLKRMYVFLVPIALTILGVTLIFEWVVFDRTPMQVLQLPPDVLASTASSVGASIGLLAASVTNLLIARLKK